MHRDPLDRLEETAERIAGRVEYEQQNRWGLLWVHACVGMLAGLQMFLWGSAGTIERAVGVEVRPILAALGMLGGFFLAAGLSRRPRSIPLEVAGLALVGLWDIAMTIGLAIARIKQNDYERLGISAPIPEGYVVAYPTTVYFGMFCLICVHLWTLRRIVRIGGPFK